MWPSSKSLVNSGLVPRKKGTRSDLRPSLKEKFVAVYDEVFALKSPIQLRRDDGFEGLQAIQRFWDELLLLKVNEAYLTSRLNQLSVEQCTGPFKNTINDVFSSCLRYLSDDSFIRVAHAIETITIFLREVLKKKFGEQGFTVVSLVAGSAENADLFLKRLIQTSGQLLKGSHVPPLVKILCIRLILAFVTSTETFCSTSSYLFVYDISDVLLSVLSEDHIDRQEIIEFEAALLTLVLFLWRDSENSYINAVPKSPRGLIALMKLSRNLFVRSNATPSSGIATTSISTSTSSSITDVFGLATWFAYAIAPTVEENPKPELKELGFPSNPELLSACSGLAISLLYFSVYFNPTLTTSNVWRMDPIGLESSKNNSPVFLETLKIFISLLPKIFSSNQKLPVGTLQVKLTLLILRCLLEGKFSGEFLFSSDPKNFKTFSGISLTQDAPVSEEGDLLYRTSTIVVLEHLINFLSSIQSEIAMSSFDPDLATRTVTLVALILNQIGKSPARCHLSPGVKWNSLWSSLVAISDWCSFEENFSKPGVPELAESAVQLIESSLGYGADLLTSSDDVIFLHALILRNAPTFEALERTAERIPFGGSDSLQNFYSGVKLENISKVKLHYELQLASIGVVRGNPTQFQAMEAVERKGIHSLKLKPRHSGPSNSYVEKIADYRILLVFSRHLVSMYKQIYLTALPKLELEDLG